MKTSLIALAVAIAPMFAASPALAQTRAEQYRWEQAQRRFDAEQAIYQRERDAYEAARRRGYGYRGGDRGGYGDADYRWRGGSADWDASRYYHDDPRYTERRLGSDDEVYRGSDGRYYCRRSDGTTGLVIGAGVGALVGHGIDTHGERATGTIVGGVLGALVGRSIDQNSDIRCR